MQHVISKAGDRSLERVLAAGALVIALLTFGSQDAQLYAYWAVCLLTAGTVGLLVFVNGRLQRQATITFVSLCGWTMLALLLTPFATNLGVHLKMSGLTILYGAFAVTTTAVLCSKVDDLVRVIAGCAAIWVVVNLLLLVAFAAGALDYDGRAFSGVYFNRNTLAVTGLVLFAIVFCFHRRFCSHWGVMATVLLEASLVLLILATLSTKGILGLLVIPGVSLWLRNRGVKRFVVVGAMSVLAGLGIALAGDRIVERLADSVAMVRTPASATVSISDSNFERLWLLVESVRLIAERPWTGVGVHNAQFHLFTPKHFVHVIRGEREDLGVGAYSHNNYTEMLLNAGAFGAMAYYLPILWLWWKVGRPLSNGAGDVRDFILVAIPLKLLLDVGMVSYYELSHLLLLAVMWVLYHGHLAGRKTPSAAAESKLRPVS